jgi:hypothetical protein
MAVSMLEQYRVNDFLDWHKGKSLELSPKFQRRSVWKPAARVMLIDTILRGFPMPKVYMRTIIDVQTRTTLREVVDGQQRLRAIIDFESDQVRLTKRTAEFEGLTYSTLPDDLKERFLAYPIAVDQLVNASDSDVFEVFGRLNSYTVSLNDAEKRHAEFQGDFKWAVHQSARRWAVLWEKFAVVGPGERLRMLDDAIMAELFGTLLQGVQESAQPDIRALYKQYDSEFTSETTIVRRVDRALRLITTQLEDAIVGPLSSAPHFVMIFAAVAHALFGLPAGRMGKSMPKRNLAWLSDLNVVRSNLRYLASLIESGETTGPGGEFVEASLANMHRMRSRTVRFPVYCRALSPRALKLPSRQPDA